MNNDNEASKNIESEVTKLEENYEDQYWSKKYGVSASELKETRNKVGIIEKIIEASFKKKQSLAKEKV